MIGAETGLQCERFLQQLGHQPAGKGLAVVGVPCSFVAAGMGLAVICVPSSIWFAVIGALFSSRFAVGKGCCSNWGAAWRMFASVKVAAVKEVIDFIVN